MGVSVSVFQNEEQSDYISLTDIAKYKNPEHPSDLIKNWLRARSNIEFLGLWEQVNNPNLNNKNLDELLSEAGSNTFVLSPTKWINEINAIGIVSKPGRYGGTYAHTDIAFEFASWVSPEFKLYLIRDYQQLKTDSSSHINLDWSVNRELSKLNYRIHTDAIKENIVPNSLSKQQVQYSYANEADRLNVALFGETSREWKAKHPDATGNIRDNASLEQLTVLANLESINAEMIFNKLSNEDRTKKLNEIAVRQLNTLLNNSKSMQRLKAMNKNKQTKRLI